MVKFNKINNNEKIWLEDIHELYKNDNYIRFIPTFEMTKEQQLNAITRFIIYFIILILIFNRSELFIYIALIGLITIVLLYSIMSFDKLDKTKQFNKIQDYRREQLLNSRINNDGETRHDREMEKLSDLNSIYDDFSNFSNISNIESGSYDSNGDLNIGGKYTYDKNELNSIFSVDEIDEYKKATCRMPDINNPMMNNNIGDYNIEDPPAACNADDENINDNIRTTFNDNLFRSTDELWERANNERQFYTMPNTQMPNNQVEFAKWLYSVPETCKENQQNCINYENNLRYNR